MLGIDSNYENLFQCLIKKFIISYDNQLYMYWRIIPAVGSVICVIFAMYNAAYRVEITGYDIQEYSIFDWIELSVEAIFCLDLILPFITEFKDNEGQIVRDITKIIWNNITSGTFFYDLIAQLPFRSTINSLIIKDSAVSPKLQRYLMLLELLKLLRFKMAAATLTSLNIKILVQQGFFLKR